MDLAEITNYTLEIPNNTINSEQQIFNKIKENKSEKKQLKETAKEFEAIFISKMFSLMDQTVDREGGIFGEETQYIDTFKSYMYNEIGRQLANNPNSTFGMAKQVYEQMEKYVKE